MIQFVIQSQLPGFSSRQSAADIDTLYEDGIIAVTVPDAEIVFKGFVGNRYMPLLTADQQKAREDKQAEHSADKAALDERDDRKSALSIYRQKKAVAARPRLVHSI